MSTGQHGTTYRPTSLDFINLPNPIEPSAGSQKHPLNGTPRLEKARLDNNANPGLFQFLDSSPPSTGSTVVTGERAEKRQKVLDNTLLDLPRLPVRNATKRMRIPPTLSGLHQPPPDAGLLPSIIVEKPQQTHSPYQSVFNPDLTQTDEPSGDAPRDDWNKSSGRRSKRNKWTDEETRCLLQGVARFGIGHWTKILNCEDFEFNHRTSLDLKDRFRVCCPDDYSSSRKSVRRATAAATSEGQNSAIEKQQFNDAAVARGPVPERVSTSKLRELGIDQPFTKSSRRQRCGYSAREDEALLEGFRKYGNSWASIRSDPQLNLSKRKATDLRDRFRTRYPDQYSKAGLALKQDKLATKHADVSALTRTPTETDKDHDLAISLRDTLSSTSAPVQDIPPVDYPSTSKNSVSRKVPVPASVPAPAQALFSLDDIFLGANFGEEEYANDGEPIILDRGILDWAANDISKNFPSDNAKNTSIDPLMTLNLPKLASALHTHGGSQTAQTVVGSTTSLPSLAAMVSNGNTSAEQNESLDLPSLIQWISTSERNAFPPLDELLS